MRRKTYSGENFDGIAPFYDALAWVVFGQKLQRAQLVWLDRISANVSILIVGGGTGWLLEQVLSRCRPKRVVYLETSSQMIAQASKRLLNQRITGSVDFRRGDWGTLMPDEHFDVILTPFVLDLYEEETLTTAFIPPLRNALKENGLWIITDFVQTNSWRQKAVLWVMIRFFRFVSSIEAKELADWQQCMKQAGFVLKQQSQQVGGMVSAEIWEKEV
ncbi:hypothetical protein GCM10028805_50710 [Spirosoma harenae]